MTTKFGRSYEMEVTGNDGRVVRVGFPMTMTFNIEHHLWASQNTAEFSLYNLNASHRQSISYNEYNHAIPYPVKLRAGYVSQQPTGYLGRATSLPIIFSGYALAGFTQREGDDLVTMVNAVDMADGVGNDPPAYLDGTPQRSYTWTSQTFKTVVGDLIKKLGSGAHRVKVGSVIVSPVPDPPLKPRVFVGSVWNILQDLRKEFVPGGSLFIENGVCHMLSQNKTVPSTSKSIPIISKVSGLIGIPKDTGASVLCSMLFEPSLSIGMMARLVSTTAPKIDDLFKVSAYTHRGTISGVMSGDAVSDVTLQYINAPVLPTP